MNHCIPHPDLSGAGDDHRTGLSECEGLLRLTAPWQNWATLAISPPRLRYALNDSTK